MPKTKNLRMDLPMRFHRALKRLAGQNGAKKTVATEIIMKALIEKGLVAPTKTDRICLGVE